MLHTASARHINEEASIGKVIEDIPREWVREVVVVNNASTDRTVEVAQKAVVDEGSVFAYLGGYFVVTQVLMLGLVVFFTRLDWRAWFATKTVQLMTRTETSHQK